MNKDTTMPPTIPAEVAQTLSHLANLIDAGLEVRGATDNPRTFAARHLGVPITEVAAEERPAAFYEFFSVGLAGVEFMGEAVVFATMGHASDTPPTWDSIRSGDTTIRYPVSLFAALSHPRWQAPIVLGFVKGFNGRTISVFHRQTDEPIGSEVLDHLWEQSHRVPNPFKNSVLSVTVERGRELEVCLAKHRALERASVFLPNRVWAELDINVGGLIAHYGELAERGLDATRGILLYGPPGTGKTAAIRTVATEQQGRATVIMCDGPAATVCAGDVMRLAADLAPSIVIIEDIDRLISGRDHSFLVALDGVEIDRTGVVLVATANDLSKMGSAALRSARFDVKVEVPLPDAATRRAILAHLLGDGAVANLGRVVAATEGAGGADLRELITAATLEARSSGEPTTAARLVALARSRLKATSGGFYL